jgi:archaemetzincin
MPKPKSNNGRCSHAHLQLEPSAYAVEAGFDWESQADRDAATTKRGTKSNRSRSAGKDAVQSTDAQLATFPGPLVLPWDELGWDPEAESQSFKSWYSEKHRNKPTAARKTLYVVDVPKISEDLAFMEDWLRPDVNAGSKTAKSSPAAEPTPSLAAQDFVDYLAAFYHGFPAKLFPRPLRFEPWLAKPTASEAKKSPQQQYVGLTTADGNMTRIRARPSLDGVFSGQLNLADILDAAIAMLPKDAYAIVLLMDHDMYEDEDDDFCCGRAYGGSRVCVVSTSRYRPELDGRIALLSREHMWPSSHCRDYAAKMCAEQDIHNSTRKVVASSQSAMRKAVDAACQIKHEETPEYLQGLWFSRVARTMSHELGHCMCLGHCVYYACLMQSTAGVAEDVRQPPYLCPVCISKISYKANVELLRGSEETTQVYLAERYSALATFCERWSHVGMFVGYQAWLNVRLADLASRQAEL